MFPIHPFIGVPCVLLISLYWVNKVMQNPYDWQAWAMIATCLLVAAYGIGVYVDSKRG